MSKFSAFDTLVACLDEPVRETPVRSFREIERLRYLRQCEELGIDAEIGMRSPLEFALAVIGHRPGGGNLKVRKAGK
ncbi:hypothetical protein [Rhodospirillum centenum]|uniref:Uncharacterized protein n=1 Tax=Rhodospirillum centenum (strain ATCC 51521 / SW) TaxID=414684 RepID=B6IPN8_RHOCS|nr:hypothetical protein [Rhodospirillum centenum]ACI99740.1 hypothetical protein RC1_2354 [Rhodospirillum centenum SW]